MNTLIAILQMRKMRFREVTWFVNIMKGVDLFWVLAILTSFPSIHSVFWLFSVSDLFSLLGFFFSPSHMLPWDPTIPDSFTF
jgi:hypothetical protein